MPLLDPHLQLNKFIMNEPKQYTLDELKEKVFSKRNELKKCPCCNGGIKDRKIIIYENLIESLYKVYQWCLKNKTNEFHMRDIREFLGKNEYARFGDLVRASGIIYKPKEKIEGKSMKALYGMNMERAKQFFTGKIPITMQMTINQINGEVIDTVPSYIVGFPALQDLLKKDGLYDTEKEIIPQTLFQI
jgi:excinuclease UvrABC ATPase subunit